MTPSQKQTLTRLEADARESVRRLRRCAQEILGRPVTYASLDYYAITDEHATYWFHAGEDCAFGLTAEAALTELAAKIRLPEEVARQKREEAAKLIARAEELEAGK